MDLKYPITVKNGDLELIDSDVDPSSQFASYVVCRQGESTIEPNYGLVSDVQNSTFAIALVGQLEKYNADQYFSDIDYRIEANYIGETRRLNLKFVKNG